MKPAATALRASARALAGRSGLRSAVALRSAFSTADPEAARRALIESKQNFQAKHDGLIAEAHAGGGAARVERQHARGKLTARERVHVLLDEGTFREYDALKTHRCVDFDMDAEHPPGDGVITGQVERTLLRLALLRVLMLRPPRLLRLLLRVLPLRPPRLRSRGRCYHCYCYYYFDDEPTHSPPSISDMAWSTAGPCMSSRRISPCTAGRSRRATPRRSPRSWTRP